MTFPQILAAGGATLALVGAAGMFVWLWASVIDQAKRFGLREAALGFAIAVAATGLALLFLALIIQGAPRAFGAL